MAHNELRTLPRGLGGLRHLAFLDVSFNLLESLPPEIGDCIGLQQLVLSRNHLTRPRARPRPSHPAPPVWRVSPACARSRVPRAACVTPHATRAGAGCRGQSASFSIWPCWTSTSSSSCLRPCPCPCPCPARPRPARPRPAPPGPAPPGPAPPGPAPPGPAPPGPAPPPAPPPGTSEPLSRVSLSRVSLSRVSRHCCAVTRSAAAQRFRPSRPLAARSACSATDRRLRAATPPTR